MNKVFRSSIQLFERHAAMQPARPMVWLKRISLLIGAMFILGCWANVASAQLMSPGYVFVEVSDQAGRPVSGAAVVLYNLEGGEIGSNVTEPTSLASIRKRSHHSDGKLVIRVIKPGYVTHEQILETNPAYWKDDNVKIKLNSVSRVRKNAPTRRRSKPASSSKRAPPARGLSP